MVKSQENDGPAVTLPKLPILAGAAEVSSRRGMPQQYRQVTASPIRQMPVVG